mgnify:CR=1 FL=1
MNNSSILDAKRIVIKVGSSLLVSKNKFNSKWLETFIQDLIFLKNKNIDILIVASGSVTLGKVYLNMGKKNLRIHEKQACAACGQAILMNNFKKIFEKKKMSVAQILLTYSDTEDRKKSLNSKETIFELLRCHVIPIVNENDSVAVDELKFGDNDRLAARVAQIIDANILILLSDVDGLFTANPKKKKSAMLVREVEKINKKIYNMASTETNHHGTGGMFTKIEAAEIASESGCDTIICRGTKKNPIREYLKKEMGTIFKGKVNNDKGFKKWLAGTIKVEGDIFLDNGAVEAVYNGASILPSGIQKISGKFFKGDIINIKNKNGKKIGKGVTYYDSLELLKILGKKTSEIKKSLGYNGRNEIVHRDYLTLNE